MSTMVGVLRKVLITVLLIFCGSTHSHVLAMRQPNIVLLVTDDQDRGGVIPMERTQKLVANMGVTFSNAVRTTNVSFGSSINYVTLRFGLLDRPSKMLNPLNTINPTQIVTLALPLLLNKFVSTPLCCPSRSSMLTGRYLHNTHVLNNSLSGGCSSKKWQRKHEHDTFATALHDEGYVTFYAGKYLNQYGKKRAGSLKHIPPGWDWWVGLEGNSRYYNYNLSINGSAKHFRNDYLTDVIGNYATDFLRMQKQDSKPFLMVVAPPAPHDPFTPAQRHQNLFHNESVPRTPNFNPGPQTDKHWLLRMPPAYIPDTVIHLIDEYWRLRWCTLLAVDELVEKLILTLKYQGQLDDTYFIFTSDNGYHLGHYGLPWDKRQPYDTDIRVPLLVRGPGIPKRQSVDDPVLLLDIAPTIIQMAGLPTPSRMDGLSFLPLIKRNKKGDRVSPFSRTFLLEYRGEGNKNSIDPKCSWNKDDTLSHCESNSSCKCQDARNNTFDCLRHVDVNRDFQFCVFSDNERFMEVYDLRNDPYQMDNIALKLKNETLLSYLSILKKLTKCRGASCRMEKTKIF